MAAMTFTTTLTTTFAAGRVLRVAALGAAVTLTFVAGGFGSGKPTPYAAMSPAIVAVSPGIGSNGFRLAYTTELPFDLAAGSDLAVATQGSVTTQALVPGSFADGQVMRYGTFDPTIYKSKPNVVLLPATEFLALNGSGSSGGTPTTYSFWS